MTHKKLFWRVAFPALFLGLSLQAVQAHEPSEHMEEDEKPDCSKMKDMDHSKMDMDDPVMRAMMKKCMGEMHQDETAPEESQSEDPKGEETKGKKSSSKHEH